MSDHQFDQGDINQAYINTSERVNELYLLLEFDNLEPQIRDAITFEIDRLEEFLAWLNSIGD